jgi:hypothetical protein
MVRERNSLGRHWRDWLTANLEEAALLAVESGDWNQRGNLPPLGCLEIALKRRCPDPEALPDDAGELFQAVGMALGQHIVEQSALHWELVGPDHRPHLAVCDPAGRELFDPVSAVGERISRGEHDFLGSLYSAFAASAG